MVNVMLESNFYWCMLQQGLFEEKQWEKTKDMMQEGVTGIARYIIPGLVKSHLKKLSNAQGKKKKFFFFFFLNC